MKKTVKIEDLIHNTNLMVEMALNSDDERLVKTTIKKVEGVVQVLTLATGKTGESFDVFDKRFEQIVEMTRISQLRMHLAIVRR